MMKKAIYEGSKEGQIEMLNRKEPIESIEFNIKTAQDVKQELLGKIKEAEQLEEINKKKLEFIKSQIENGVSYPKLGDDTSLSIPEDVLFKKDDPHSVKQIDNLRDLENSRITKNI